jgi:hypothetical protein
MNEDMILPDDFEESQPQETEETLETVDTQETESPETTEAPPAEENPFLKVKYNGEEMTLDEVRARELAQKGMNYDKIQEKLQALESDPRLSFVESLASQHGMDVNQYLEAVKQQQEQEKLNELIQANIPEHLAKEVLESRKFRDHFEQERQAKAAEEKANAQFNEFFAHFEATEGRAFDTNKDQIPQSVWEANAKGVPLKQAYMEHQFKELQQQLKTLKQNESNAKKAPVGSLTRNGSVQVSAEEDDPFLQGFNSI